MGDRIRPAHMLDMLPLSRTPQVELWLDVTRRLLYPHRTGRGVLTWLLSQELLHTLLRWSDGQLLACAQARIDGSVSSWEVQYLASWRGDGTAELWEELLSALGSAAGRQGMTRLLARVPDETRVDIFRQAGFTPFAEELILVWEGTDTGLTGMPGTFRPARSDDAWALQRLRVGLTPPIVQQAEGSHGEMWPLRPGDEAWVWPQGEAMGAYVHRERSSRGTRVGLLLDPALRQDAPAVLSCCLAGAVPPVYLVLRGYQGELLDVARRQGFRRYAEQFLLVKHLAVRQQAYQPLAARQMERSLGTAPGAPSVGKI